MKSRAAKLIFERRKKLGISQGKLCKKLGYKTPQYLSNFERGLCYFAIPQLRKCCVVLAISPNEMKNAISRDIQDRFLKEWGS